MKRMKLLISIIAFLMIAPFQLASGAFAQSSSCQGWHSVCLKRCQETQPGNASCPKTNCGPKLATCRSTGCWQEGQAYGGGKVCGLAK